ncbi:uncharacterized protein LOC124175424 isoform X1 [Neodiprion fabricii]|uniref:uncharacterized protein LOC124175424 isoform X1 n=1 Tax=Neodiprion fabricii TaxID=2872261 RepID=UPI001ED91D60|nr:uncharacterized protein LOC124175424 isoform X1 [Neodiprion fabricii]
MAIMQSCCCWRSVRRGSIACAIYTGLYFALTTVMTTKLLDQERQYLAGNLSAPQSASFLEPETISPTTVRFNIVILSCSSCGVLSSILLLYGLFKDQRALLIPWIFTVITFSVVDITHSMYVCFMNLVPFNPITAMLFTLDFFVVCLNVYSLLCVISQYQEYVAGRGTAADDCEYRVPAVRYAVQPTTTATSCLSSRRAPTNNETRATATPTQSPTAVPAILANEKSPVACKPGRKHVQFPDTPTASQGEKSEIGTKDAVSTWNPAVVVELGKTPAVVDTAPLLSSSTRQQQQQQQQQGEAVKTTSDGVRTIPT